MHVVPVPCLADNYAWLLTVGNDAVIVDPSEPDPVLAALGGHTLVGIWCTHHHLDHVGGVEALLARWPVPVIGSRHDLDHGRIPGQTHGAADGEVVRTGPFSARVTEIPGHTLGAIAYEVDGWLFTGDTLFAGGCGRVFEGTMPMMRASLARLAAMDPALRVACGHEYTVKNLEFAEAFAPGPSVDARLREARERRARGEPAVGDALAVELATNPMLRWDAPEVRAGAAARGADPSDPDEVFATVRRAKDKW